MPGLLEVVRYRNAKRTDRTELPTPENEMPRMVFTRDNTFVHLCQNASFPCRRPFDIAERRFLSYVLAIWGELAYNVVGIAFAIVHVPYHMFRAGEGVSPYCPPLAYHPRYVNS